MNNEQKVANVNAKKAELARVTAATPLDAAALAAAQAAVTAAEAVVPVV